MAIRFTFITSLSLGIFLISSLIVYIFGDFFYLKIDQNIVFHISNGQAAHKIITQLQRKKIIRNQYIPKLVTSNKYLSENLKAGRYQVTTFDNIISLFHKFYKGNHEYLEFKIIPGTTISELENNIINNSYIQKNILLTTKDEGVYFPSTYYYEESQPINIILNKAKSLMNDKLSYYWENRLLGLPIKNQYELLVVASLIEKETDKDFEKGKIARVIYNRLTQKIPLQFCSSVIYILKDKRTLTYNDLKIKNPYNTYRNRGLPPTPIAYPSESSLKAAAYPDDGSYLYFTLQKNGTHHFSNDFKDHKKNKI
tara:strand:- start:460 stop:1392 length:933 start_codon:yes stop_codon:yes gene_type:complete